MTDAALLTTIQKVLNRNDLVLEPADSIGRAKITTALQEAGVPVTALKLDDQFRTLLTLEDQRTVRTWRKGDLSLVLEFVEP